MASLVKTMASVPKARDELRGRGGRGPIGRGRVELGVWRKLWCVEAEAVVDWSVVD